MANIITDRWLTGQMKTAAFESTGGNRVLQLLGKTICSSLEARATAVCHTFLGHGFMHGTSNPRSYQNAEADRNTLMSSDLQLPRSQTPSFNTATYGFNSQPRKPIDWMTDSHTRPANSRLAAHGCYRVVGPARISKRGGTLVAHLFRGSRVELLDRNGNATPYGSMESCNEESDLALGSSVDGSCGSGSLSAEDECCLAECVLVAAHVELCGSARSVDLADVSIQSAVHRHNGHTYVSVRSLPPEAVIELDADADLRHPIDITPLNI